MQKIKISSSHTDILSIIEVCWWVCINFLHGDDSTVSMRQFCVRGWGWWQFTMGVCGRARAVLTGHNSFKGQEEIHQGGLDGLVFSHWHHADHSSYCPGIEWRWTCGEDHSQQGHLCLVLGHLVLVQVVSTGALSFACSQRYRVYTLISIHLRLQGLEVAQHKMLLDTEEFTRRSFCNCSDQNALALTIGRMLVSLTGGGPASHPPYSVGNAVHGDGAYSSSGHLPHVQSGGWIGRWPGLGRLCWPISSCQIYGSAGSSFCFDFKWGFRVCRSCRTSISKGSFWHRHRTTRHSSLPSTVCRPSTVCQPSTVCWPGTGYQLGTVCRPGTSTMGWPGTRVFCRPGTSRSWWLGGVRPVRFGSSVVESARQLQRFIYCRGKGGPVFSTRDLSSPTHSCIAFQTRYSCMDLQLPESGPIENWRSMFRSFVFRPWIFTCPCKKNLGAVSDNG